MKFVIIWLFCSTIQAGFGEFSESIDLGYGFDDNTVHWFGMPGLNLSKGICLESPYMLDKKTDTAVHVGTYLDAPYRFNPNGWKVADIPLDRLIVPGVVINKQEAAEKDSDTVVTVHDLVDWEQTYGSLPDPVAVIFDFGWASKYQNKTQYFGMLSENSTDMHFPGLSEGAADWLVHSGKVVGVGVDTPSVNRGVNKDSIAQRILTAANIYLMEDLALAGKDLPARGFQLSVMPMKIINGTRAPLRIIAQPIVTSEISFFSMLLGWISSVWITFISMFK